jgi:hypothetical protein
LFGKIVIISKNQEKLIGSITRSKMYSVNVNNLSVQNLFFLCMMQLYLKKMVRFKQKICNQCKVYHYFLLNTMSQLEFDCFSRSHNLYLTENDKDMSRECYKVVEYYKEKNMLYVERTIAIYF